MKRTLITALLISILVLTLVFRLDRSSFLRIVYAADAYGSDIQFIEVHQYNGTHWNLVANFTATEQTDRVHDSYPTNFTVSIKFNSTLASSTAEAIDYTRVYMNISESVWTNEELNNTACSLVGDFYILTEQGSWVQEGKPESGITYECSVLYQGYY